MSRSVDASGRTETTQQALVDAARELLTPAGIKGMDEWVTARIRWHRLDGNDALADELLREENSVRRAMDKEPLRA